MSLSSVGSVDLCFGITYDIEGYAAKSFGTLSHRHAINAMAYCSVVSEAINRDSITDVDAVIAEHEASYKLFLREIKVTDHCKVPSVYSKSEEPTEDGYLSCLVDDPTVRFEFQYPYADGGDALSWHRYVPKGTGDAVVSPIMAADFPVSFVPVERAMTTLQRSLLNAVTLARNTPGGAPGDVMVRIIEARLNRIARAVVDAGYGFRWEPCFFDNKNFGVEDFRTVDLCSYTVFKLEK